MFARLGFAGRLMAIMLLALLALSAAIGTLGYIQAWKPANAEDWAVLPKRAAAVVELLDRADARQRALILKAINSEHVVARVSQERPVRATDPKRAPAVEWILSQFLEDVGQREVFAVVETDSTSGWRDFRFGQVRMFAREPLRIAIALADGQWIVFETRVEISPRTLGIPPGFVIGAVGALVGIASLMAIAREAKPLGQLAQSVTLFAKDATPKPVTPRGAPEIAALIVSVNDMQSRIAALLKGRTVLLGAISHDLKTFITRLRLRAEAIPDAEQLAKATQDLDDMTALIDDALAVARGTAVSARREHTQLADLIEGDIGDRPGGAVSFSNEATDGSPTVHGDAIALRRLFANLIDNALHHGTRVHVTVATTEQTVSAIIDDDGPGIPESERTAVFEPFYRLDPSRSRTTGGSGLGLAIAKQIVTAHDGQITITQSPLGGARFQVDFPRLVAV